MKFKISISLLAFSLWLSASLLAQSGTTYESLFSDSRALRVGDVLTIHIVEYSKGENESDARTRKNSDVGMKTSGSGPLGFIPIGGFGVRNNVDFAGRGEASQTGSLQAKMTARITSVDQNGNLVIQGTREITVNKEKQTMTLDGIVRPEDISRQNIIMSYHIADAKISYQGNGHTRQSQKPGWLTRIFNWLF